MKLNNLHYADKVKAIIEDKTYQVYFLGGSEAFGAALIAIPKPNLISQNFVEGYFGYGYVSDNQQKQIIKDFPSEFYSFWAIKLDSITNITFLNVTTHSLENILAQLEDEIK